jgi:hypothetical protein
VKERRAGQRLNPPTLELDLEKTDLILLVAPVNKGSGLAAMSYGKVTREETEWRARKS